MCGCPLLGTLPETQACALNGNQTSNSLVCRPVLSPLSHTRQGCSPISDGDLARRGWGCQVCLPASWVCLPAIAGTKVGTTTSFPLIISFVLKNKQPGSRREKKEKGNGGAGNPLVTGSTSPILCNDLYPMGSPMKAFCGASKFIPHQCSDTVAFGGVFCASLSPLYRGVQTCSPTL